LQTEEPGAATLINRETTPGLTDFNRSRNTPRQGLPSAEMLLLTSGSLRLVDATGSLAPLAEFVHALRGAHAPSHAPLCRALP
jgi:hypothetical protein